MIKLLCVVSAVFLLSGCISGKEKIKAMEDQNLRLTSELKAAEGQIGELKVEKNSLRIEVADLIKLSNALDTEKSERKDEAFRVRQEIRVFLKQQVASLNGFLGQAYFMDMVGNELLDREEMEGAGATLLDMKNGVPSSGVLKGAWGYFKAPCSFRVVILRPAGESRIVIWESEQLVVAGPGTSKFTFDAPVSIDKEDVIGYSFEGEVSVPFSRGTGGTPYVGQALKVGDKILDDSLQKQEQGRAYSLVAVGLFGKTE